MYLPDRPRRNSLLVCIMLVSTAALLAENQPVLSPETQTEIDTIANQVLKKTGAPSASLAVVKDGRIAYIQAYGDASVEPAVAAKPEMRYSIGSISKQFTAAAILLLAEDGKLQLNDPVSKYVKGLTHGDQVTIRQLLSHTSGYQDYWPQDYVPPFMLKETTEAGILERWAQKPLDFDPGTRWQYSNTNFVIAGLIVEKAAGMPLLQFLNQHIFVPLGMKSVADIDQGRLPAPDAAGYCRYALGPLRPAPKEGKGWLFAAAELAMTAEDLQKWNISVIRRNLLKPGSYREMESETRLNNGEGTGYGLGISVGILSGHRVLRHGGEVSGFTAFNAVLPDDGLAVAVLTNQDATDASSQIGRAILARLSADPRRNRDNGDNADELVKKVLAGLAAGKLDRELFTEDAAAYFSETALRDYAATLAPLGAPRTVTQTSSSNRGGMIARHYSAQFAGKTLEISIFQMPDGPLEQFQITGAN